MRLKFILGLAIAGIIAGCGGGGDSFVAEAEPVPETQIVAEPVYQLGDKIQSNYTKAAAASHTPATIRAAYNMAALPEQYDNLSSTERAALGAGQTIYVISSFNNPTLVNDLNTFSKQFNLPTCTGKILPKGTVSLPPHNFDAGCEVNIAYTYFSSVTSTVPKYDQNWAVETALDVQWAHASAPLARIVVILAPSAYVNALYDAVAVANNMGPGVVSMSFAASEYNPSEKTPRDWVNPWDRGVSGKLGSGFRIPGMTYIAASGDRGGKDINVWPASSPSVLGIGGTTLQYDGISKKETVWGKSGGSWSRFAPAPYYQSSLANEFYSGTTPLLTFSTSETPNQRPAGTVDVSFNADPATGQQTYISTPEYNIRTVTTSNYYSSSNSSKITVRVTKELLQDGRVVEGSVISTKTTTVYNPEKKYKYQTVDIDHYPANGNWYAIGGTSIGAPQWAGIVASINAQRELKGLPRVSMMQEALYTQYAGAFSDITEGNNGVDCKWCLSQSGYDAPSGLGTPNVGQLTEMMTK